MNAGVIHRDVNPGTILFTLGIPKVIDFGLATAPDTTSRRTSPDPSLGTVDYMAPERFSPGHPTRIRPAADICA